jgi:hypothetical protein
MKPVLRIVVDKNGAEEEVFTPSARMVLYSIFKAEAPGEDDAELCRKAGIDSQLPGRWRMKFGSHFINWLEEAMDMNVGDEAKVLERVGMMQAVQPGNYQYWRDMARSKGVIKEAAPVAALTLNTNFTAILQLVGGDLNAARAKLLEATRGLAHGSGSALAEPAIGGGAGSNTGEGDRARHVQGEPLEMAHSLGSDRGRPEQRASVSAVPEQAPFTGSYRVLDEGEIPAGSEKPTNDGDMAF